MTWTIALLIVVLIALAVVVGRIVRRELMLIRISEAEITVMAEDMARMQPVRPCNASYLPGSKVIL